MKLGSLTSIILHRGLNTVHNRVQQAPFAVPSS